MFRATTFDASTVEGAVQASNAFAFDFYRKVQKQKRNDNVVCSPAGAVIALTMVAAGARGETQTEMLQNLALPSCESRPDLPLGCRHLGRDEGARWQGTAWC